MGRHSAPEPTDVGGSVVHLTAARPGMTPARHAMTPSRPAITLSRHAITPARHAMTPARHAMTPARHLLTPTGEAPTSPRHARSGAGADDTVPVDLFASEAFVDDLTLINADDQLLDGIAAGRGDVFVMPQQFSSGFPAGSLAPLLATWRSEIVDPQWPSLPTDEQVREAVRVDRRPMVKHTTRALKPVLGVAIAISALLFSSAAVGAQSAKPGDALWPLAQVLYSDRADSYAAGEAASRSLNTAKQALSSGDPTVAMIALDSARGEIKKVQLVEQTMAKQSLELDYETLLSRASSAGTVASAESSARASAVAQSSSGVVPAGTTSAVNPTTRPDRVTPTGTLPVVTIPPIAPVAPVAPDPSSSSATSGTTAPLTVPVGPTHPATTANGPSAPVTPDPVAPSTPTSPVTTAPVTTAPATTPAGSTVPATTAPVTTAPVTTDPVTTDPSTDPVTTDTSTTSELPTPTPPDPTTDDPGAHAPSIASAAIASQ